MSNPNRRPCHNKDFLKYNNIINGADWHNVPGSKNLSVGVSSERRQDPAHFRAVNT